MNFRNDWEATLEMANKDLEKYGMKIRVLYDPDDDIYSCDIHDGFEWVNFADNYYENELGELVNDAWTHARAKAKAKEPVKVWVVTFINDHEWELPNVSVNVFGTKEEARQCLDDEWQTLTTEGGEWQEDVSRKGDDDFMFVDSCENRVIGEIEEKEVKL